MSNHSTKAGLAIELKIARHHNRRQLGEIEKLKSRILKLESEMFLAGANAIAAYEAARGETK